ncbi:MAG TPA: NAD(P)-binding domain-containing protein [Trebonia sp.]|nr:NAD(P)-binding domain-containing protein [Trebonia sp.]
MTETVGIIGAGVAGKAIARVFLTAGRNVVISNSRGPDTLGEVIAELGAGAEAGTAARAAQAPLVVLAIPWTSVEDALAALPSWSGRTLVDATNAYKVFDPPNSELFDFGDRTSSEVVASLAPGASVVKALNHVPFMRLLTPVPDGERHVLFLSGDDAAAKAGLRSILRADNFAVIDLGDLATGSRLQQAGGPLSGRDLRLAVSARHAGTQPPH